jgi:hypothetical protein
MGETGPLFPVRMSISDLERADPGRRNVDAFHGAGTPAALMPMVVSIDEMHSLNLLLLKSYVLADFPASIHPPTAAKNIG